MSLPFVLNNLHFTVEIVGALCFFVMAYLAADAYSVSRQTPSFLRIVGFSLIGAWQIILAMASPDDVINFVGSLLYIVGIIILVASFLAEPRLRPPVVAAVLFIPAFADVSPYSDLVSAVGLGMIAYLSFRQYTAALNRALKFFCVGFLALALAQLTHFLFGKITVGEISVLLLHAIGWSMFVLWIWQYIELRLKESIMLIFISLTLFIATIITLAFSTILMSKVEAETRASLATDTRVVDLVVGGLREEARAKAELLAERGDITGALREKNSAKLEGLLSDALDREKLGFLLVTDRSGTVLLRGHALSRYGDSIADEASVARALLGESLTTIESSSGEQFSIRAATPLSHDGEIIGALVAGYPLDNVFADRMKKITGLEMSIYEGEKVVATTALAEDGRTRLSGVSVDDREITEAVLVKGGGATARVDLRGERFLASYLPIKNVDGEIVGMFSASKPQQEIIALANATNRLTFMAVIALLIILSLPLYLVTRRLLSAL